jgi:hypothetical protein
MVILFVLPMFRYVIYIVLPASANGESVSSNVCEFGRKYFIIFAFREANFVSAIKANVSRCGRQGTTWAYGPNLVWGGGGTVLVCPTALLTQCTYTTLFDILSRPFLRIFSCGGGGERGAFFEKGPFCEIIY